MKKLADTQFAQQFALAQTLHRQGRLASARQIYLQILDAQSDQFHALTTMGAADLFLDTQPYNGGTTTSDALWAGLPVLTLAGQAFASRVAASLLTAIDLPELIATTQQHYEELAIELALNPNRLAHIRTRLRDNRLTSPLFDTPRFTRNLEAAYAAIHDRYQAGLPTDHMRF
jgi:predicted O-linked N-acetylglucosamine transferase (SPINDLY family)